MFPTPMKARFDQTQVRAVNSRQPSRRSEERLRRQRLPAREPERDEEERARGVAHGVDADRPARTDPRDDEAAGGRADHLAEGEREPAQRVCLLEELRRHRRGRQRRRDRLEERERHAAHRLEDDELPDPRLPGDEQHGDEPWLTRRVRSDATITPRGWKRSAKTPPTRRNATSGRVKAAKTRPTSVAEPVRSSTANGSATLTIRRRRATGSGR
jgi:hypothetical protein